tara:strand:+ start:199 stop:807 length:609 start_codon:yes stop_codon:yes gene_type:complete
MVKIHGKDYMTVAERLNLIAAEHKDYELTSEVINLTESACCIRATLKLGERIFNGLAYEEKQNSHINKTSYVENCETSAWGRAMAAAGYAGTEIASAEEVANAVNNQQQKTEYKKVDKPKDSPQETQKAKNAIHDLLKNYTPEQKKDLLKKATYWEKNDSYCDDINDLTVKGRDPSVAQMRVWYKKLQEAMLSEADFVSDEL